MRRGFTAPGSGPPVLRPLRRPVLFGCIGALLLSGGALASDSATKRVQAMWEEPAHQPVFHRGHIRVMDVYFPGGATSEYHFHENAATYVFVQPGRVADQAAGKPWVKFPEGALARGMVLMRTDYLVDNLVHRVRNIDTMPTQIFAVVNLSEQDADPAAATVEMRDGEIDNAWFRVRRLDLEARGESARLTVADDSILMQAHNGGSHVRVDGRPGDYKTIGGAFSFHPAGSRLSVVNEMDTPASFVLIEVKD